MNKQNIEQIIRELFRQNFNAYPESYPLTDDGLMTDEGTMNAQDVAKGYWAERNEDEIERDEKAGVTEIDYVEWVMAELSELIPAASTKFQRWAAEINKDWGHNNYKATAEEHSVIVYYKDEEVARLDYNNANGRYAVSGTHENATEQLEWFLNR